ncbi:MAG: 30S ribosomal protein S9 [Candidatus Omnitrophica bacterium]|nr:30S ribosomal protein S9 [Candidatus Omnitrophota bacterium]
MSAEKVVFSAVGRRKEAIARVRIFPGTGVIKINRRKFENYFPRETHRIEAMLPFDVTATKGKFDVAASIIGGGDTGQAGALKLGIARSLLEVDIAYRAALKKEGLLTRDPRAKERKKYGQKRARKSFQFSKR